MKTIRFILLLLGRHRQALSVMILLAVSLWVMFPILSPLSNLNNNPDFLQLATRHYILRENILNNHQFPLRTQYLGGGYPTISDPEDPSYSPFAFFTLAFGEIAGLKLIALTLFLTGTVSMYLLSKHVLKFNEFGAIFSAFLLALSG
jgi:hypothetical protein